MPVILHILDDEGDAKGFKAFQEPFDLFRVHGEGRVLVVEPGILLLVEGQGFLLVFPGKGGYLFRGDLQDDRDAGADLFLIFLHP